MSGTSLQGGGIIPVNAKVSNDGTFEDFWHSFLTGVTGLANADVRPKWQFVAPEQPDYEHDWIAFGILSEAPTGLRGNMQHVPDYANYDTSRLNEPLADHTFGADILDRTNLGEMLVTAYGPNAMDYQQLITDGLLVEQNRWCLQIAGVGIRNIMPRMHIPEMINNRWLNRVDQRITYAREVRRVYPVFNLVEASGTIYANTYDDKVIETPFDTDWYSGA